MIQKLNWENRMPVNVLSNNAVRYGIYDSEGNLLRYEYIKKEDEAVIEGTRINKMQGDKIDDNIDELIGERSRVDRYNIPTVSVIDSQAKTNDIIPKSWYGSSYSYYYNNDETIRLYVSSEYSASYKANLACDGDISTRWQSYENAVNEYLKLYFTTAVKITKMKIHITASISSSYLSSWKIQGSNDDSTWTDLYTATSETSDLTEITLSNANYYNYYRIYITKSASNRTVRVYEWQVSEYITKENLLTLNNDIGAYINNEIVLIDITDNTIDFEKTFEININSLGNKEVEGIDETGKYKLIYNGTKFIAHKFVEQLYQELEDIKQAIIDLGGVI